MNDRRYDGYGVVQTWHSSPHRTTRTTLGSTNGSHRLSAYERLNRPVRSRRSQTSFTASGGGGGEKLSDVSSSLVSPTHVTHATPRPKSPREPRFDYAAAAQKFQKVQVERQQTAKRSNTNNGRRSSSAPIKRRSKTPTQPILAAQHFQSAVMKQPRDFDRQQLSSRPRQQQQQREPSWKTTDVTISGDSTTSATTPSSMSSPPRLHQRRQRQRSASPPLRPSSRNSRHSQRSNKNDIPVRTVDPEESLLRGCIQGSLQGGALLGSKFTECLYLSADVYQQECGPHQKRGGDRMFLYRKRNNNNKNGGSEDDDDDDDIVEDDPSSFYSESRSKLTLETDPTEGSLSRHRASPWSRSRSPSPAASEEESEINNKSPTPETHSTPFRSNRTKRLAGEEKKDEDETPTRRTYPRRHHDSFDVAPQHAIRYDVGEMPRLHIARGKTPWEEPLPDGTNEFVELRNLRLSMFTHPSEAVHQRRHSATSEDSRLPLRQSTLPKDNTITPPDVTNPEIPEPAEIRRHSQPPGTKLPAAAAADGPSFPPWRRNPPPASLQKQAPPELPFTNINSNDNNSDLNEVLRKELEETKQSLKRARDDLQHAQELALRQQANVQTRTSQLATEKLRAEAQLKEEARARQDLLQKIGKLQEETTQLKTTLQSAQREAGGALSPNRRPPRSPSYDSRSSARASPAASPNKHKELLAARNLAVHGMTSPDRALADDMYDETSPTSSKDDDEAADSPVARRMTYDSGAVLNLVREVVKSSKQHASPTKPKTTSPVSVMDEMDGDDAGREKVGEDMISTPPRKEESSEAPKDPGSPYLSSRLISLRSELLDVRSQLAEANAARIKAESKRDEVQKMNSQIQRETRKLREEVNELKQLVMNLKLKEGETEEKFQRKVDIIKVELSEAKERAEQEEKAREKLEEELTDTQNEADELRGQVARFMSELERTKSESEQKLRVSDAEAKNLQEELRQMKLKLSRTNSEIVQQAAEHLKKRQEIEAELEQSLETASALQKRVLFMDDQLTNAENETEMLRSQLVSNEVNRGSSLSPTAGSWRKSFAGVAESFSRSLSDGIGDGPIIIPEAPPKDARSSVMERLRNTLDPNHTNSS